MGHGPLVSEFHIGGFAVYNNRMIEFDNNLIFYGKPTRADLFAEMADAGLDIVLIEGEPSVDITLIRRLNSVGYMTRKEFRTWLEEKEQPPTKEGYKAYIYALALNEKHCYSFVDFQLCVPSSVDFDDINAVIVGAGFRLIQQGTRNRIDFGASGECTPSENWASDLIQYMDGYAYWHRNGYLTRKCD